MGKFEKVGFRNLGLRVIESINWIRIYGLSAGSQLFKSTLIKKGAVFYAKAPFLKENVLLRNNKSDKPIFFQVFYEKQYDLYGVNFPETLRIIDGGANIGCASIYFSIRFPKAEIIAVEPEENNFKLLNRNTKAYKNIYSIQAGIWNEDAELSITNPEAGAAEYMFENKSTSSRMIKGITIPSLLAWKQWNEVDIIKLDIEGAEKEVFSANDLTWLKKVKLLIIELHDRYKHDCTKTVFKALDKFNYDAYFHHENIFIFFK